MLDNMNGKLRPEGFRLYEYLLFAVAMLAAMVLCVCAGSVGIPVKDTVTSIFKAVENAMMGLPVEESIIISVRLPRVLSTALVGAPSVCGAAIQGLPGIRWPTAYDGRLLRRRCRGRLSIAFGSRSRPGTLGQW